MQVVKGFKYRVIKKGGLNFVYTDVRNWVHFLNHFLYLKFRPICSQTGVDLSSLWAQILNSIEWQARKFLFVLLTILLLLDLLTCYFHNSIHSPSHSPSLSMEGYFSYLSHSSPTVLPKSLLWLFVIKNRSQEADIRQEYIFSIWRLSCEIR
jgi:hypothetical protein